MDLSKLSDAELHEQLVAYSVEMNRRENAARLGLTQPEAPVLNETQEEVQAEG